MLKKKQRRERIGNDWRYFEDDFADAVVHVKERELLYGDYSLLGRFGPLKEIVHTPNSFQT